LRRGFAVRLNRFCLLSGLCCAGRLSLRWLRLCRNGRLAADRRQRLACGAGQGLRSGFAVRLNRFCLLSGLCCAGRLSLRWLRLRRNGWFAADRWQWLAAGSRQGWRRGFAVWLNGLCRLARLRCRLLRRRRWSGPWTCRTGGTCRGGFCLRILRLDRSRFLRNRRRQRRRKQRGAGGRSYGCRSHRRCSAGRHGWRWCGLSAARCRCRRSSSRCEGLSRRDGLRLAAGVGDRHGIGRVVDDDRVVDVVVDDVRWRRRHIGRTIVICRERNVFGNWQNKDAECRRRRGQDHELRRRRRQEEYRRRRRRNESVVRIIEDKHRPAEINHLFFQGRRHIVSDHGE